MSTNSRKAPPGPINLTALCLDGASWRAGEAGALNKPFPHTHKAVVAGDWCRIALIDYFFVPVFLSYATRPGFQPPHWIQDMHDTIRPETLH